MNIVDINDIDTFLIKSKQKIPNKYINDYLLTQIKTNNIILDYNSKIFYTYILGISSYQISILNIKTNIKKNLIPIVDIFKVKYLNNSIKSTDLYITNSFISLYQNQNLVYFKTIDKRDHKEDILEFINQTLCIQLDNIYEIDDIKLQEYKKEYISNIKNIHSLQYISKYSNKYVYFYISYCLVLLFFIFFYYFKNIYYINSDKLVLNELSKSKYIQFLNKYQNNSKVTKNLIYIFEVLGKYSIKLEKLDLKTSRLDITIISNNDNTFLEFLEDYDKNALINSIKYIKDSKLYEMNVNVRLY